MKAEQEEENSEKKMTGHYQIVDDVILENNGIRCLKNTISIYVSGFP